MIACDICTAQLTSKTADECQTCQESKQYCKPCLKNLKSKEGTAKYCPSHWDSAKNALSSTKILTRYVRQFWKELGIEPNVTDDYDDKYYDERNHFSADFYGLRLLIEYFPNYDESGNLVSINHSVEGLVTDEKIFTVPVHNHENARVQVQQAIMSALKSKRVAYKSAKSKKLNEIDRIVADYDQKIADVDTIIKKWKNGNL